MRSADPSGWDTRRRAREAEIRRRYDRDGVRVGCGRWGPAVVGVVDRVAGLDVGACRSLHRAYETAADGAEAAGLRDGWYRAFAYGLAFPEHPGDLYAISAWFRIAFDYAGLVAAVRADAVGAGAGVVPAARAAAGVIMALSVDAAASEGWYHPVGTDTAAWLRRPWEEVEGPIPPPGAGL